jgi:hypothetical protein
MRGIPLPKKDSSATEQEKVDVMLYSFVSLWIVRPYFFRLSARTISDYVLYRVSKYFDVTFKDLKTNNIELMH